MKKEASTISKSAKDRVHKLEAQLAQQEEKWISPEEWKQQESKLHELQAQLRLCRDDLAKKAKVMSTTKAEQREMEERLQKQLSEVATVSAKLKAREKEVTRKDSLITELRERLHALQEKSEKEEREMKDTNLKLQSAINAQETNKQMINQLKLRISAIPEAERERDEAQSLVQKLKSELSKKDSHLKSTKQSLDRANKVLSELKRKSFCCLCLFFMALYDLFE